MDAERRSALLSTKLNALVRDHLGAEGVLAPATFALGAAIVGDGTAWILLDEQVERGLGPAMAWAGQHHCAVVHVLAAETTGLLARRAGLFAGGPDVWTVTGRELTRAVAASRATFDAPPADHLVIADAIAAAGVEPVIETGVLRGEVDGLEVCRVSADLTTGVVRLEVGVGIHDREAFQLMHGDVPTTEALAGVADAVRAHRRLGAPQHPFNQLVAERLLGCHLRRHPEVVGCRTLARAEPPVPRGPITQRWPFTLRGETTDGVPVVVVTSHGVDLDLVPWALDARDLHDPSAELIIALPARDLVEPTRALAGRAARAVRFAPI